MKARNKRYAAILSVVTVLALALSLVAVPAPSFAATSTVRTTAFPDVQANAPYATAFNVLAALGVYQGDQNGNANPNQTITRAEAAAVAVRLAGYSTTAAALQNQTPSFKDASQIPSWAWGVINTATTLGIINGYPDGTFRASNAVTQAEMLAMITRVLGNQGGVVGPWPTNYVAYATQAGLLNGITNPSANIPATRADVAFMAYNALGVTKKWDSSTNSFDKDFAGLPLYYVDSSTGQTKAVSNPTSYAAAKHWVVTGTVQSVSPTGITLSNGTTPLSLASTVNVSGAADLASLINQTVSLYGTSTDSSGNLIVAAAAPSASQAVTSGTINAFTAGSSIEIGSTTYGLASSVTYTLNGQQVTNATYFANFVNNTLNGATSGPKAAGSITATVTLDPNNHVTAVSAWAPTDVQMISSVSPAANSASNNTIKLGSETNAYVVDNATLTLDGKAATINDINTAQSNFQSKYGSSYGALAVVYTPLDSNGQVVTGNTGSTNVATARVDVYDTVVTGTVVGYGADSNGSYMVVSVNGSNQTLYKSGLSGAGLPGSAANPTGLNSSVSVLVDGSGKVYKSLTAQSSVTDTVAALAGTSVTYSSSGNTTTTTFTMPDGSTVTSSAYASLTPVGGAFYLHFSGGSIASVESVVYGTGVSGVTTPYVDLSQVTANSPNAIGSTGLNGFVGTFGGVSGNVITVGGKAYPLASKALVYDTTDDLNSGSQGAFSDLSTTTTVIVVEDSNGYVVLVVGH